MRARRPLIALLVAVVMLGWGVSLSAQESAAAPASDFTSDYIRDFERVGGRLVALAEAVPAEKYAWRPSEDVRTVSEVYMHVYGTNMLLPPALGAAPPEGVTIPESPFELLAQWEATVTRKEDVVARLKESIAYAAQAVRFITDHDTQVNVFGFPASKRAYLLILLTHAHEHLGQSIAYARSIGVVPPWSQPAEGEGSE